MSKRYVVVNVCWYDEAQWPLVKSSADDPERFEDTYGEWKKMMEKSFRNFEKAGILPVKISVNALELMGWLVNSGSRNNGESRARFVSETARVGSPGKP